MNKQEVIEKLREHGAWCTECHDTNGEKDRYVKVAKVRELLEQIDEPQADKVEVKRCVAEFYEANKDDLNFAIYEAVAHSIKECGYKAYPEGFMDWLIQSSNNPFETLIRMKDGYIVKPKRWVVKNEEGRYFVAFSKYAKTPFEGVFSASVTNLVTFTDKSKAEAVATLVEGSVEEVAE